MIADRAGPTSRFYTSQRLKLHYADWGNPTAPPLLLLHGGRDHCRSWDWVAARLCRDWHVIALDWRGHGDSAWSPDGSYASTSFIYDLAQLIHQLKLEPVSIVAHSYGGNISLRYAGIYPDKVRQIVAIEGLGWSPKILAERASKPVEERMKAWIEGKRGRAGKELKRYPTLVAAAARMREANAHLSEEQVIHLTEHGVVTNEDGSYSWKFDRHFRSWPPYDIPDADVHRLWRRITCPALMIYGKQSNASNPLEDGRSQHFSTARFELVDGAGHWVHHDRLDTFMDMASGFLRR
jgi:pimeloyl-ACP methyl ester carboxylesterase